MKHLGQGIVTLVASVAVLCLGILVIIQVSDVAISSLTVFIARIHQHLHT